MHVQAAAALASTDVLADMAAPSSMEPMLATAASGSNDPAPTLDPNANPKGAGKGKGRGEGKGEGKQKREKKEEQISSMLGFFQCAVVSLTLTQVHFPKISPCHALPKPHYRSKSPLKYNPMQVPKAYASESA